MANAQTCPMPELIFSPGEPHPQCHAATLAKTPQGLVAAWFGGTHEKHQDVGIWQSRHLQGTWSPPVQITRGQDTTGIQVPCWNPVLHQTGSGGPLLLFYKVGATIAGWSTMLRRSQDDGASWSNPVQLPSATCGPVKNKPLELADGVLLCGGSLEPTWQNWQVYFSRTDDLGESWHVTGPCTQPAEFDAIQPSLFDLSGLKPDRNAILALCRTRQGVVGRMESADGGLTWSPMTATNVPNPDSGLDGTSLTDGRLVLVCNDTLRGRSPLSLLISEDGQSFRRVMTLEDDAGEFSYPSVIRDVDTLHIVYTHRRTSIAWQAIDVTSL